VKNLDSPMKMIRPKKTGIALIVESDEALAGFLLTVLQRQFKIVLLVENVKQARKLLRSKSLPLEVVVIDLHDHHHAGGELMRELRQSECYLHVPVLMMNVQARRCPQCAGYGGNPTVVLSKPFTYQELNYAIEQVAQLI
jgi:DNA-binding response OmpR family regulator